MDNTNGTQSFEIRLLLDKLRQDFEEVKSKFRSIGQTAQDEGARIDEVFRRIGTTVAGVFTAQAAMNFARQVASVRGEFQQLEVAFRTMLGSAEKADALMSQLVRTAAITPFDLQGVANGAKQLLAYGLEADKVNETLIRLGDIAAGLSIPLGDLVYLYGTTMTQGRLFTQDLRQFMGRGIPLADELAKQFGVAKDKVGELVTAGKVGFPEVQKAIEAMTNEGGKFAGLMEAQSKTISGQISNLEDAIASMFNEIGKQSEGIISGAISGASYLVENYEKVGKAIAEIVATFGVYKAALATATAMSKGYTIAELAHYNALVLVEKAQKLLNATMLKNPYVLAAAAVAGLGYGLYKLVTYQSEAEKAQKKLNESFAKANSAASLEISELARLKGRLQAAKEGTEEYNRIRDEIVSKFGQYDNGLKAETLTVETLAKKYESLSEAITKSYNTRQYHEFLEGQTKETEKVLTENYDRIYKILTKKYGDELGAQYTAELQNAVTNGSIQLRKGLASAYVGGLKDFEEKLGGAGGVLKMTYNPEVFTGDLVKNLSNILNAQNILKKNDALARTRFFGKEGKPDETDGTNPETKKIQTFSEQVKAARENVANLKKELNDLKNNHIVPEGAAEGFDFAEAIKAKEKELADAQETLNTLTGYDPKAAEKARQERERGAEELDKLQKELAEESAQAAIDMMEDASERKKKQIEHDYEQQRKTIQAEEEKMRALQGGTLTENQEGQFKNIRDALDKKEESDLAEVHKAEQDALEEMLGKYQSYTDQRLAIEKKFNEDINALQKARKMAEAQGNTEEIARIDRSIATATADKGKALMSHDFEVLKQSPEYIRAFEDLKNTSSETLNSLLSQLENAKQAAAETLNPEDLREYTTTVQEIMDELDARNPFQALADRKRELAEAGEELAEAEKQLKAVQNGKKVEVKTKGADGKDATTYLTAAKALENYNKAKDKHQKANNNFIKAEKTAKEKVDELSDAISGLGNAIGGQAGEIISLIGDVVSFTTSAIDGVTLAARTAVYAISMVEKASVILTIISAALQIGMKIASLFNNDDAKQKQIEALQDKIDRLQWELDNADAVRFRDNGVDALELVRSTLAKVRDELVASNLAARNFWGALRARKGDILDTAKGAEAIKKLSTAFGGASYSSGKVLGSTRYDEGKKQLDNYSQQIILMQEQIEKERSKKKIDNDKITEWEQKIEELGLKMTNVLNDMVEDIIGGTAEEIAQDLGDAFFEAFQEGEDAAEAWGKKVDEIVGDILKKMLIQQLLEKPIGAIFDKYKKIWFQDDGTFNGYEAVKNSLSGLATDVKGLVTGFAEGLEDLPDELEGLLYDTDTTGRTATAKGIAQASQDSVDELNGRFTAIQGHTFAINENVERLAELQQIHLPLLQNLSYLATIDENTYYCRRLDGMDADLRAMRQTLENIEVRGITVRP